jgi:hypothetical protein
MEYQNDIPSVRPFFDFRSKNLCQASCGNIFHLVCFVDHNRHMVRETGHHGRYQEHQQKAQTAMVHILDFSQMAANHGPT